MEKLLHIGIDLTGIWRRQTGIFRYTAEMAKHLLLISPETKPAFRYTFFFAHEVHPDFVPLQDRFVSVLCPTRNELLSKQFWFPAILPRLHLDVMHYPTFPPPYLHPWGPPTVMTFYDAGPWHYAQAITLRGRFYFRTLLTRGMKTSAQIMTLSAHAKAEIGQIMGERYLQKISIAPGAARTEFTQTGTLQEEKIRAHYQLPETYILTVATIEPRKNLTTLLDAYVQLRQQLGPDCPTLVIVGRKGWLCDDILHSMETLQETVRFLGYIPDQDLIALYQCARCFIFPSLYEGFGLPVVEAMKASCPVITTTSSSLPEVAGGAALLVNPLSANEMSVAMQRVLQDNHLRNSMIAIGRTQGARFSWQQTAQLHREAYAKVALAS